MCQHIDTYRKQPDNTITMVGISENDISRMEKEAKRTGLGGKALLSRMSSVAEGLTDVIAKNIANGRYKSAEPEHVKAILEAYEHQPDKKIKPAPTP